MKTTTYRVYFSPNTFELVEAFGIAEAIILAQACRIRQGLTYTVQSIEEVTE